MRTFLIIITLTIGSATAQNVKLAWDSNTETNVIGYSVYASGVNWSRTNTVIGITNTTTVFSNLPPGKATFFCTARALDGIESDRSNDVSCTNRNFAPRSLRVTSELQGSTTLTGGWQRLAIQYIAVDPTNSFSFYRSKTTIE